MIIIPSNVPGRPTCSSLSTTANKPPSRSRAASVLMGQSFNLQGIKGVGRVLFKPSLMVPHLSVPHIGHINFQALKDAGR